MHYNDNWLVKQNMSTTCICSKMLIYPIKKNDILRKILEHFTVKKIWKMTLEHSHVFPVIHWFHSSIFHNLKIKRVIWCTKYFFLKMTDAHNNHLSWQDMRVISTAYVDKTIQNVCLGKKKDDGIIWLKTKWNSRRWRHFLQIYSACWVHRWQFVASRKEIKKQFNASERLMWNFFKKKKINVKLKSPKYWFKKY